MMAVKEITGKHVAIGFVAAFSLIIAVNLVLAFGAVRTFPGLEVKNSYVASQEFNARKSAQEALGWQVAATHEAGELWLTITDAAGHPVEVTAIDAVLGRATHVREDMQLDLRFDGSGYVAPVHLEPGNWNIRLSIVSRDGTEFQQRVVLIRK